MSFGPRKAEYAAVGQTPWSDAALIRAKEWLKDAGVAPSSMYWTTVIEEELRRNEKPTTTEVKHGQEQVREELAKLPNLKAVILFGSYAVKMAFSLKGGITRVHGQSGKLALPCPCGDADDKHLREVVDGFGPGCIACEPCTEKQWREVDCVACLHPSFVGNQTNLRQKQLLDSDCRAVVTRLTYVSEPLVLPKIAVERNDEKLVGRFGLDTETEFQVGKKVDPRRDPLLITGISDGSVFVGAPEVLRDAEPIAHNMPFDAVVIGQWEPQWHDSKMLAHLLGMYDTTLKGAASRILGRPMMEYDPDLRTRAAAKIRAGMTPAGDEDVKVFMGYCAQDALAHRDLFSALWAIAPAGTKRLYEEVERPMLRLYARWMMEGVWRIDKRAAKRKRREIDKRIREMRRDLLAETGIASPNAFDQLKRHLGLPTTEAKWVEKHWKEFTQRQKKVLRLVRELRTIERQVSTYIDAWLEWPHDLLSTNWRPTAAWTGRPGSAHLNLQNIPGPCGKCKVCRRGEEQECPLNLRPLLLAPEGMALYELDNSQAELRVAAHLSQDANMILAFTEGLEIDGERIYDLHEWAKQMLGFSSRRDAKIRVLATFYGQTGEGARADPEIQAKIRSTFRGYVQWSNKVKHLSIVPGLFGRSLYVPPHPSDAHREREAINAPSQGGAVDVLKMQINDLDAAGFNTRHQIHDSVFVMMPEAGAGPEVEREMTRIMEEAVELTVPLKVDCKRWNP